MRPTYFTRLTLSCLVYGFVPFFPVLAKLSRNPVQRTPPSKSFDSFSFTLSLSLSLSFCGCASTGVILINPRKMGVQRIVLHENIQFGERGEGGRGWGWGGEGGNGPRERSREPISENGEFSGISCEQQPLIKYDIIPIPRRAWSPSTSPNMAKAESGPRRPYRLVSTPEWIENIPSLSLSLSLSLFRAWRINEREGITMKAERSCDDEMNGWLEIKSLSSWYWCPFVWLFIEFRVIRLNWVDVDRWYRCIDRSRERERERKFYQGPRVFGSPNTTPELGTTLSRIKDTQVHTSSCVLRRFFPLAHNSAARNFERTNLRLISGD